jgi:putative tricarboxylic transport membrane protein
MLEIASRTDPRNPDNVSTFGCRHLASVAYRVEHQPPAKVDPVGPRLFPIAIGAGLIVLAMILAIAIPRGSVGEADAGEDVDPNMPGDWRTVGLLVGVFVATIVLVQPLGWAITGALLFAGSATILGGRHYIRNIVIGAVLSVGTFYAFYSGLGIPLPAGILDGVL